MSEKHSVNEIQTMLNGIYKEHPDNRELLLFLDEIVTQWSNELQIRSDELTNISVDNSLLILQNAMEALELQSRNREKPEAKKPTEGLTPLMFAIEYCKSRVSPFYEFYLEIEDSIMDDCRHVVTAKELMKGKNKAQKKFNNALKEYGHNYDDYSYIDPPSRWSTIALFDNTVFGSAKEGLCFTDYYVIFKFGKSSSQNQLVRYSDIKEIVSNKQLKIKAYESATAKTFSVLPLSINEDYQQRLSIVCNCLMNYICQPAYIVMQHLYRTT